MNTEFKKALLGAIPSNEPDGRDELFQPSTQDSDDNKPDSGPTSPTAALPGQPESQKRELAAEKQRKTDAIQPLL
jgi:hypothetical protein